MKNTRKIWFIIGGVVSILWGLFHVTFLQLAFDPTLMWLPEGATMNDAAMIHIGDFITLLNNALTIYMLGVGLLMIIGAGTLAASRLGTGLLVMHIVFWAVRAVVPFLQMGRIPDGNAADLVMSTMLFAASLTVYAVPLFLGRSTGEKYR